MKEKLMTKVKISLIGGAIGTTIGVIVNVVAILVNYWFSKD